MKPDLNDGVTVMTMKSRPCAQRAVFLDAAFFLKLLTEKVMVLPSPALTCLAFFGPAEA
jgi:hypothetical protein